MKFLKKMLFYISVPKCVFCGERLEIRERVLCKDCMRQYFDNKSRNCPTCSKMLGECSCTNEYLDAHYVHKLIKVYRYQAGEDLPTNTLLYKLKRDYRNDVFDFLSDELSKSIAFSCTVDENTVITNVPRRRSAKNQYGYDHAKVLAKAVAKKMSAEYCELLVSKTKSAQKTTRSDEERKKNAVYATKSETISLAGKKLILIDDIVTTGASLGACAEQLKHLGAKQIIGAAVAIAYKDKSGYYDKSDRFFGV